MNSSNVVIVGGGVVGCATAYYLAKAGAHVTVLERRRVAYGASGYAMGLLSPLSGLGIPGPLEDLSLDGFLTHRELAAELPELTGVDYHAKPQDSIYLAFNDAEASGLKAIADYANKVDGVQCSFLDAEGIRDAEPRAAPAAATGLLIQGAWVLDAEGYTRALAEGAKRRGARFVDAGAVGLERRAAGASVRLSDGTSMDAGAVVLAMGPWTGEGEAWLGQPLPIAPLKGQILRMEIPGPPMACSIHYDSNYAGPKHDGLTWVGTTEERVGFDNEPTQSAREKILSEVSVFYPPAAQGRVVLQTACLRPVAPDGLPVMGPISGWDGVYVSTGAGRKGIILSPSMGKQTTAMVLNGSEGPPQFSPQRFTNNAQA